VKQHPHPSIHRFAALALGAGVALSAGCATTGNPKDPLEGFNRAMFAVNEGMDKVAFKPIAQGYDAVVPLPGKTALSNFFSNLADPWIAVNNLAQGKAWEAFTDAGRFLINSTVGILGAFDVASEIGLEKHEEDFGQTLGRWGVGDGPFIELPFFGPRTTRDAVAQIADSYADPLYYAVDEVSTRNILYGTRFTSNRAQLLPADKTIEEAALDKYAYIRDGYLQRRRSLIYDGRPPREKDDGAALEPDSKLGGETNLMAATQPASVTSRAPTGVKPLASQEINHSAPSGVDSEGAAASAAQAAGARPRPANNPSSLP
jgi:phospholipid-binding lipoprotein MlaA